MTKEDIIEKYTDKAKEQRKIYGLCPHPTCDGHGKCLCVVNTEGCLNLVEEYETIVNLISSEDL